MPTPSHPLPTPPKPTPQPEGEGLRCYSGARHELENIAPPSCVIEGVLLAGSLTLFSGETGTGRSMIALDMALSIATGRAFQGRQTRQGVTLYVGADGARDMAKRVTAWERFHGESEDEGEVSHFFVVPQSVQVHERSERSELLGELLRACESLHSCQSLRRAPALIVIDTLSLCSFGLNENNPRHMERFLAGARPRQDQRRGGAHPSRDQQTRRRAWLVQDCQRLPGAPDPRAHARCL